MNTYIIDTGAICLFMHGDSPRDTLEKLLILSATIKPSLYAIHQPIISMEDNNLIVCNVGDMEVRIYPCPVTIDVYPESYYLSAPFTNLIQ